MLTKKWKFSLQAITVSLFALGVAGMVFDIVFHKKKVKLNEGETIVEMGTDNSESNCANFISAITNLNLDSGAVYCFKILRSNNNGNPTDSLNYTSVCISPNQMNEYQTFLDSIPKDSISLNWAPVNGSVSYNIDVRKTKKVSKFRKKSLKGMNIEGDVSFCVEDSMRINESYKALLIISKDIHDSLINEIQVRSFGEEVPKETTTKLILAEKLFASLQPALAEQFKIIRVDLDSIKTIETKDKDYVTWEWIITPLKVGTGTLILSMSRVDKTSNDLDKFIPAKIIPVEVYTQRSTTIEKIGKFFREDWKFLLTTICGGIGWVLLYRKDRKKGKKDKLNPGRKNGHRQKK